MKSRDLATALEEEKLLAGRRLPQRDVDRVLKWLGFESDGRLWWLRSNIGNTLIYGHDCGHFSPYVGGAGPDYMVLVKVRIDALFSQRMRFLKNLDDLLQQRFPSCSGHVDFSNAMLAAYEPGDFAEAARFLWEASDDV